MGILHTILTPRTDDVHASFPVLKQLERKQCFVLRERIKQNCLQKKGNKTLALERGGNKLLSSRTEWYLTPIWSRYESLYTKEQKPQTQLGEQFLAHAVRVGDPWCT